MWQSSESNFATKPMKRKVDLLVISDIHLGTYGCSAEELLCYLHSISPKKVVLNGDIIDIWQFSKRYWPKSHMAVLKYFLNLISEGVEVCYVVGNHDETLRKFIGFGVNNFSIQNKLLLELPDGKKAWIFHGDVFDVTMKHSKWLAKLGGHGYDLLIVLNRFINFCSQKMGRGKISLSKRIKNSVKSAIKFINNFEETAADIAIDNGYDYVICGHIHQPIIKTIDNSKGQVQYMNSGDWIENLTALEYTNGQWSLFEFSSEKVDNLKDVQEIIQKSNEIPLPQILQEQFMD
jgi:UDP-2,3-diacylglucosamine pyrophosphatase LpxH